MDQLEEQIDNLAKNKLGIEVNKNFSRGVLSAEIIIPSKILNKEISNEDLPNTYDIGQISTARWTFRKETKLRDKYCRIKVRYSGEELAIISAVLTTFNISYA